jgi:undecaprenyl-diphosphatase
MRRSELIRVGIAVVVLAASTREARRQKVSPLEEAAFRAMNEAPDRVRTPVWAVSQAGSLPAVFVAAGALAGRHQGRRARLVAVGGTAAWSLVKVVKALTRRGRPADELAGVRVRERPQRGRGFPSGHAAVSATLAIATTRPGAPRAAGLGIAAVTSWSRAYLGAHLPLDLVGGAAIGTIVGTATDVIARTALRQRPD